MFSFIFIVLAGLIALLLLIGLAVLAWFLYSRSKNKAVLHAPRESRESIEVE
jgi:hypothetical protein